LQSVLTNVETIEEVNVRRPDQDEEELRYEMIVEQSPDEEEQRDEMIIEQSSDEDELPDEIIVEQLSEICRAVSHIDATIICLMNQSILCSPRHCCFTSRGSVLHSRNASSGMCP